MEVKLLIVTDLGLLKAYKLDHTPRGTPHLEEVEEVRLEEAHQRVIETVTDVAGRRGSPTRPGWGAPLADAHNLELETERRLIRAIVEQIERLGQRHRELGIWLAVPREINHLIVEGLPRKVRERIQVNLSRNLVKASKEQLLESLGPGVQAAR